MAMAHRYQALRPEWERTSSPQAAVLSTAGRSATSSDWRLELPGDALQWQLGRCAPVPHYLHIQYSSTARHDLLGGAVAVDVNHRFQTGTITLGSRESGWLVHAIPADAFGEESNAISLRSCNAFAGITVHGVYLSAYTLPVQEHSLWCWAAILSSLDGYYARQPPRTQAGWACHTLGKGLCVKAAAGCARCRQAAYIHEMLQTHGYLHALFETATGEAEILEELRHHRPVIVTQKSARDVYGHFVVVYGINPDGTWGLWNPRQPGIQSVTFDTLSEGGEPKRRWTNTFFTH